MGRRRGWLKQTINEILSARPQSSDDLNSNVGLAGVSPPQLYLLDMVGFFSVIFQAGAVGGGGWPQSISWWVEDDLTHNWQNHRLALSQSSKHQHVSPKQCESFSVSTDGFHSKYTLCNIFPIQLQFE